MSSLRPFPLPALLLLFALLLTACGGAGGDAAVAYSYHVDVATGDDGNPGTQEAPFKTISKALGVAGEGQSIKVAPGIYSAADGETFPLVVGPGIELIGDEPSRGDGPQATTILGKGPATLTYPLQATAAVMLQESARLAGFTVYNPGAAGERPIGVALVASYARLERCTLRDSVAFGVWSDEGTWEHTVRDNDIRGHRYGAAFVKGGTASVVEGNVIRENQVGIGIVDAEPDLGGGIPGSQGGNTIAHNTGTDLYLEGLLDISAQDNRWDQVPVGVLIDNDPGQGNGVTIMKKDAQATVDTAGGVEI